MLFSFDNSNGSKNNYVIVDVFVGLGNSRLAAGSWNGTIRIWDTSNGQLENTFDVTNGGHSNITRSLAGFDNGFLASGSYDMTIKIWK